MKLYLSQPISGIPLREYEKTRAKLEDFCKGWFGKFSSPVEFVNQYITETPPDDCRNKDLWYIGKSIDKLSYADFLVIVKGADLVSKGCKIEKDCAEMYNIPVIKAYLV